jgi:hypothetical protein
MNTNLDKYLKYKKKYNNLLNELKGGVEKEFERKERREIIGIEKSLNENIEKVYHSCSRLVHVRIVTLCKTL